MKTSSLQPATYNSRVQREAGLTLIELLVIIAIMGFLAGLLLPMMPTDSGHGPAIRIKCLNNLKQLDLGLLQYGNENDDRLPEAPVGSDRWAWDMPEELMKVMARQGITRETTYDPGFPQQNDDRLWNAAPDKYRVIGYALALGGTSSSVTATNQNSKISPQFILQDSRTLLELDSARRVLLAGAVITPGGQNKTNEMASYNRTKVKSSFPVLHSSAHLDKAKKLPLGESEGMLDGSARWFNWKGMIPRTAGPAEVATFWW
jgi:Prokaryotic N-terminal methylation motif